MSIQEETAVAPKLLSFVEVAKKAGKAAKINEPPPFAKDAYEQGIGLMLTALRKLEGNVKVRQLELGRYLRVAKGSLEGEFGTWIEAEFKEAHGLSRRTAFYYISLADAVDLSANAIKLTLQDVSTLVSKNTDPAVGQQAVAALDEGDIKAASAILNATKPKKAKTEAVVVSPTQGEKSTAALEGEPQHAIDLAAAERMHKASQAVDLLEAALDSSLSDFLELYLEAGPEAFDATVRQFVEGAKGHSLAA